MTRAPLLTLAALLLVAACGGEAAVERVSLADLEPQQAVLVAFDSTTERVGPDALEEALPFTALLPMSVPDGLVLERAEVHVPPPGTDEPERSPASRLYLVFGDGTGDQLEWLIMQQWPQRTELGEPSAKAIDVDGHPGLLFGAGRPLSVQWYVEDCDRTLQITGVDDQRELLLALAESVQDEC